MTATIGRPPSCLCGTCRRCKHRLYMRDWYRRKTPEERRTWTTRRDPETARRSDAKRSGTGRRRASSQAHSIRQRERSPEKYRAHNAVNNAVRDRRLIRELCWCGEVAEAHHPDYSKPLEVVWLCRRHHRETSQ